MPREAEDLAEDMIFRLEDEQAWLEEMQRRLIANATQVQHLPKAVLNQYGPTTVRRRMMALNRETQAYFRTRFDDIYLAGARSIDPASVIGPAERRFLARLNTDEYLKLRRAQENVVRESKRFTEMVWNDRVDRRKKLGIKYTHVDFTKAKPLPDNLKGLTPQGIARLLAKGSSQGVDNTERTIRLRGIKAAVFNPGQGHSIGKKYKLNDYGGMVLRTNANRAYNMGVLNALKKKGVEFVNVSDGPECGWSYHEDGDLANGKVVTIDEANAFPIAHPNCRRTFAPATPQDADRERERRGQAKEGKQKKTNAERAKKAITTAALFSGGILAAAEATNLAEFGITRFVASDAFNNLIERQALRAFQGDTTSRWFVERLSSFQSAFTPGQGALASVSPIYPGGPINLPSLPLFDTIRYFADGAASYVGQTTGITRIPENVKHALGVADDAIEERLNERFQAFYHAAKRAAMSEDVGDNLRNVIDMEAKRRGAFERIFNEGQQKVLTSWSRWGPRIRVDANEFLRFKGTFTKTGPIYSGAVNAAGQVRGVVKMYQDGLIGGHISALPKNIANGIFRAIVEIDEQGHLVGNLRLVPGGPLRLRLEFITDNVTQDLRDFRISPLGALGNTVEQFKKFKFDRAVLEMRIFNQSVFEIAGNLRLPVEDIRRAIRAAKEVGDVVEAAGGNRYSGTIKHFIQNPDFVKKIFGGSKATLFGNIRFSSLTKNLTENSGTLRLLKNLNVRILTKAKLANFQLQAVATNMRIHGWNIYDIANVLKIRLQDAQVLVKNGSARLERFMVDLGIRNYEDIFPVWRQRVADAQQVVRRSRKADAPDANMAETIAHALRPFYFGGNPQQVNAYEIRALQALAGLKGGETQGQIYNKLTNMLSFLRDQEWVEGNYVASYADGIVDYMVRLVSRELVNRAGLLRVV